jgi:hypothetical protein
MPVTNRAGTIIQPTPTGIERTRRLVCRRREYADIRDGSLSLVPDQ